MLQVIEDAIKQHEIESAQPLGFEVVDIHEKRRCVGLARSFHNLETANSIGKRVDGYHFPSSALFSLEREKAFGATDVEHAHIRQVVRQSIERQLLRARIAPASAVRDQAGPRFFETRKAPLPPDGGSIRQSGDRDDWRLARRWTSCASKSRSLGTLPIICVFESCFLSIRPLGALTSSHPGRPRERVCRVSTSGSRALRSVPPRA